MSSRTRRGVPRRRSIHGIGAVALLTLSVLLGWAPTGDTVDAAPPSIALSPAEGQSSVRSADTITVSFRGMPPGPVSLYQCIDPAYLAAQGLEVSESCQLNTRVVATAGPDGSGSAKFPVFWRIDAPRQQQVICLSSDHCSIRVTSCPHLPEAGPNATLSNLALGQVIPDPEGGDSPINPPGRFQRPRPTPPELTLPDPIGNITRPQVRASGGTGADIAMRIWGAETISDPALGVDVQFIGRNVAEAYEELLEGRKDFVVAAMPLRGELIYPYQAPLPLDPSLSPEERDAALAAREADRLATLALQAKANEKARSVTYVPLVASSLDVVFDIAPFGVELEQLRLDSRSLARIFGGGVVGVGSESVPTISTWRDPAITAINPECPPVPRFSASVADGGVLLATENGSGQATPVRAMNRSDVAESSFTFREWLGDRNPTLSPSLDRPSAQSFRNAVGKTEATGSSGVGDSMSALSPALENPSTVPTPGRVAYLEHPYALRYVNRIADVENASGEFVSPNPLTVAAALQTAQGDPATGLVAVNDTDRRGTPNAAVKHYPLVQIFYAAITPDLLAKDPAEVAATKDFLAFTLSDEGQAAAGRAGYSPLPNNLRQLALTQLSKATTPAGPTSPPVTTPPTTVPSPAAPVSGGAGVLGVSESAGGSGGGSGSLSGAIGGSGGGPLGGGYGGADALEQSFESGSGSGGDGSDPLGDGSDGALSDGATTTGADDEGSGGLLDSVTDAVARPVSAVLDVLGNPGQAPSLFALMVVGGVCCVVGPLLSRRRPGKGQPS